MTARYYETKFGFVYGPAEVIRVFNDDSGRVVMDVNTPRDSVQIYVTPTGLIRVSRRGEKLEAKK